MTAIYMILRVSFVKVDKVVTKQCSREHTLRYTLCKEKNTRFLFTHTYRHGTILSYILTTTYSHILENTRTDIHARTQAHMCRHLPTHSNTHIYTLAHTFIHKHRFSPTHSNTHTYILHIHT